MFYKVVVQAVLLFRSESWVMSAAMEWTVEGKHAGFLQHITGKREWRNPYGAWVIPAAGEVLGTAGIQL